MIITVVVMNRMTSSRFGRSLVAIREDQIAATSLGINTGKYEIWAFAITAAFAGISGSFFAHYMNFINPNNFTTNESILILCMITVEMCIRDSGYPLDVVVSYDIPNMPNLFLCLIFT